MFIKKQDEPERRRLVKRKHPSLSMPKKLVKNSLPARPLHFAQITTTDTSVEMRPTNRPRVSDNELKYLLINRLNEMEGGTITNMSSATVD